MGAALKEPVKASEEVWRIRSRTWDPDHVMSRMQLASLTVPAEVVVLATDTFVSEPLDRLVAALTNHAWMFLAWGAGEVNLQPPGVLNEADFQSKQTKSVVLLLSLPFLAL